jgi:hypothetical protein
MLLVPDERVGSLVKLSMQDHQSSMRAEGGYSRPQLIKLGILAVVSISAWILVEIWRPGVASGLPPPALVTLMAAWAILTIALDGTVIVPILNGRNPPALRVVVAIAATVILAMIAS